MSKRLIVGAPSSNHLEPRIGGAALIGGIVDWPLAADGSPLVLVASIPNRFISNAAGLRLAPELHTSVFSYFSEVDYFLDEITYHGSQEELECLLRGGTKVLQHPPGSGITQSIGIPPHRLELGELISEDNDCGSRVGAPPCLLQNETLDLQEMSFALQLRSSDFPGEFKDIFGLPDALGYLYLREESNALDNGIFFVQTT
jgi:hypothetical protein